MRGLLGTFFIVFWLSMPLQTMAQWRVAGVVTDTSGVAIPDVSIFTSKMNAGSTTDIDGKFSLNLNSTDSITLIFRHLEFISYEIPLSPTQADIESLKIRLRYKTQLLDQVEIVGNPENVALQAGAISLDPKGIDNIPSPFQDISRLLVTLPGVVANNELSSTYSVRGGNYEENQIYVDDIPIYRPFLIRMGQQEGLGFVNVDMIDHLNFHAGGWQPKYGDKLSSTLNVSYKKPTENKGSFTAGLLGGSVSYEGISKNRRIQSVIGLRRKDSRYLLNSLEVQGEYFPTFTDLQSYTTFDLSKAQDKSSELSLLVSYARNRYETFPVSRQTDFGTLSASFRLFVAFQGVELMNYDTYQSGLKWTKKFSRKFTSTFIASGVRTSETERFEVEGGYRLCDINNNPASSTFDECVLTRGVGTNYQSGRNSLFATLTHTENRNKLIIDENHIVEFGVGWSHYNIEDKLREFNFLDSAGFSSINERAFSEANIISNQLTGYVQHAATSADEVHAVTYGVRLNYWDYNGQLLVSPRVQYAYQPRWRQPFTLRASVGSYQQPPFYRELRNRSGMINPDVMAQSSIHYILGSEYHFNLWGRTFVFFNEMYYKQLYNLNLYDIENVRLRYFADNAADGYAAGLDLRVHGEFIPGVESWFSLGLLNTKENILDDDQPAFRRPSDQRINLSIFFQDHMPNDPSLRIALTLLYGSGFPFGPPGFDNLRNAFSGDEYYRADISFSKVFDYSDPQRKNPFGLNSLWVGLEILNMFGADNTISYTWIKDVANNQFAVPNGLSARFLNIKIQGKF